MWKIFFYLRSKKLFHEFRLSALGTSVATWFNHSVFLSSFINENTGEEGCDDTSFMSMMSKNADTMQASVTSWMN